jgi:hypothetical protein
LRAIRGNDGRIHAVCVVCVCVMHGHGPKKHACMNCHCPQSTRRVPPSVSQACRQSEFMHARVALTRVMSMHQNHPRAAQCCLPPRHATRSRQSHTAPLQNLRTFGNLHPPFDFQTFHNYSGFDSVTFLAVVSPSRVVARPPAPRPPPHPLSRVQDIDCCTSLVSPEASLIQQLL